jgi:hypothetical protein
MLAQSRDPTSQSLESIQSPPAEHDLCAAFSALTVD